MGRTLSLRQRLYVITLVALAPALLILLYNESALRQSREAEIHRTAAQIGELASLEVQRIIDGAEGTLRAIARAPSIRQFDMELCVDYLADVTEQAPQFSAIAAIDTTGLLRCRFPMPDSPLHLDQRPYFNEVMATERLVVGSYTVSAISGKAVLPLAVPIRDRAGTVTGVVVGGIDLDWLNTRIAEREFPNQDALTLADRNGVIIARYPFPERFVGTKIPDAFMHLVTGDVPGTMEVMSQDGTRRIIGYYPASRPPLGIYVSAGVSYDTAMQPVNQANRRGAIIVALGAAIALLVATLTGIQLVRAPVDRLMATIGSWRRGDITARTGMKDTGSELSQVGAAIDVFLDELAEGRAQRRRAEAQRELLARELQHRIKNILGTVQALASQTFKDAAADEALAAFNARLASLAKAHELLTADNWSSADLRETIETAIRPFRPERFEIEGPPLHVSAKATLAVSMAVHELATNAVKYGALGETGGEVRIDWSVAGDTFCCTWREHGGPRVGAPSRTGFGTRMIERMLAAELGGKVDLRYPPAGVECQIEAPLSRLLAEDEKASSPETQESAHKKELQATSA